VTDEPHTHTTESVASILLQNGSQGARVREAQRLLNAAGYRPALATDGIFGPATERAVRWFQARRHLAVDGVIGPVTWAALHAGGGGSGVRTRIVALCRSGIAHEPAVHYTQSSRRGTWLRAARAGAKGLTFPAFEDCSSAITGIYRLANAPDPSGAGYDGPGTTGTFLAHCTPIGRVRAKPGDIVVFGPGTGEHAAIVMVAGADPLLFSHGQERGPLAVHFAAEHAAHGNGKVRWLRVPGMPA
jgi:Putative peptidoglycan binding domain